MVLINQGAVVLMRAKQQQEGFFLLDNMQWLSRAREGKDDSSAI